MTNFVSLSCPSCGAKLQIGSDLNHFACGFCGNKHIVNRAGGTISISPLSKNIEKIATEVDKTSSELAIKRLEVEIPKLERDIIEKFEKEIIEKYEESEKITNYFNMDKINFRTVLIGGYRNLFLPNNPIKAAFASPNFRDMTIEKIKLYINHFQQDPNKYYPKNLQQVERDAFIRAREFFAKYDNLINELENKNRKLAKHKAIVKDF